MVDSSESRFSALVGRPWFWVICVAVLFGWPIVRTLRIHLAPPPPVLGELPAFTLTDENNDAWASKTLAGRILVVSLAGTQCGQPCDAVVAAMYKVQHRSRGMADAVHLVTVARDAAHETPASMAAYARAHRASPRMWSFLSGSAADLARVRDELDGAVRSAGGDGDPQNILMLVDQNLRLRGVFDATQDDARSALLRAIGRLGQES